MKRMHYGKDGGNYQYDRVLGYRKYKALCSNDIRRDDMCWSLNKVNCKDCLEVLLIKKNDEMAKIVAILKGLENGNV